MSDLDEKLIEVLEGVFYKGSSAGLDYPEIAKPDRRYLLGAIVDVKRVLMEAGWDYVGDLEQRLTNAINKLGKDIREKHRYHE